MLNTVIVRYLTTLLAATPLAARADPEPPVMPAPANARESLDEFGARVKRVLRDLPSADILPRANLMVSLRGWRVVGESVIHSDAPFKHDGNGALERVLLNHPEDRATIRQLLESPDPHVRSCTAGILEESGIAAFDCLPALIAAADRVRELELCGNGVQVNWGIFTIPMSGCAISMDEALARVLSNSQENRFVMAAACTTVENAATAKVLAKQLARVDGSTRASFIPMLDDAASERCKILVAKSELYSPEILGRVGNWLTRREAGTKEVLNAWAKSTSAADPESRRSRVQEMAASPAGALLDDSEWIALLVSPDPAIRACAGEQCKKRCANGRLRFASAVAQRLSVIKEGNNDEARALLDELSRHGVDPKFRRALALVARDLEADRPIWWKTLVE